MGRKTLSRLSCACSRSDGIPMITSIIPCPRGIIGCDCGAIYCQRRRLTATDIAIRVLAMIDIVGLIWFALVCGGVE